jgi:hypothetical protein
VAVLEKNGKLKICVDFRKFNITTKKDPYLLLFMDEVINTFCKAQNLYLFGWVFRISLDINCTKRLA